MVSSPKGESNSLDATATEPQEIGRAMQVAGNAASVGLEYEISFMDSNSFL